MKPNNNTAVPTTLDTIDETTDELLDEITDCLSLASAAIDRYVNHDDTMGEQGSDGRDTIDILLEFQARADELLEQLPACDD